ncbi:MAG: PAS domain S-box protein [Calditrichaeota bacterium]|nr:PAS domain S-box protein [Calditrichota bacterium]MBT7787450.1 PAS domain S-box protein [Calditrichota bacterium]
MNYKGVNLIFCPTGDDIEKSTRIEKLEEQIKSLQETNTKLSKDNDIIRCYFDAAKNVILRLDLDDVVIGLNTAVEEYFGVKAEEVINKPLSTFHNRVKDNFEDPAGYLEAAEKANFARNEDGTLNILDMARSGLKQITPIEKTIAILPKDICKPGGELVGRIITFVDTTQLSKTTDLIQTVVETSPIPTIVTKLEDGKIIFVNKPLADIFDVTQEEAIGKAAPDFYANPDDRSEVITRLKRDGFLKNHEVLMKKGDGSTLWMIFNFRITQLAGDKVIVGTFYEISERKEAEDKLRESEERFRQLTENIGELFWMTTPDTNEMIYISPMFETIFGRSCEEIFEKPGVWLKYLHEDDREFVRNSLSKQITGEYSVEYRIVHPDGSIRWVSENAYPIKDSNGKTYRVCGVVEDITERKNAESELRLERNFVSTVLDTADALILVLNRKGEIIRFNRACERITGYSLDDVTNTPFWETLLVPEETSIVRKWFDMLIEGEIPQETENYWISKSGKRTLISWNNSILVDKKGDVEYIISIGQDVTERHAANEKLKLYREIFMNCSDGIVVNDAVGNIVEMNPAYKRYTGFKDEDFSQAKDGHIFIDEDDHQAIHESIAKTDSFNGEIRSKTKDGSQFYLDLSLFPLFNEKKELVYYVGMGRNISQRKKDEEIISSRLRYEIGLAGCSQALLSVGDMDETLNHALKHLLEAADTDRVFIFENFEDTEHGLCMRQGWEYCAEGVNSDIDNPLMQCIPTDSFPEEWLEPLSKNRHFSCTRSELPPEIQEIMASSGTLSSINIPLSVNNEWWGFIGFDNVREEREWDKEEIRLLRTAADMIGGYITRRLAAEALRVSLDDLEKANQHLVETQGQLVQSEKMASLGMLVAGIAHEINTPIGAVSSMHNTSIRAFNKLHENLKSFCGVECLDDDGIIKTFKVIEDGNRVIESGIERVTTIIKRLRSFARLDEAEIKEANLHEGLEDTLVLIHHETKHNIEIIKNFGEIPVISCFPGRLNQVFLNMLINAKQAIKEKGKITISTHLENDKVYIKFADDGVGITKDKLSRVFDPGFTTKGVGVGTGLGLSICYQIIQDHHGTIKVDSEVGKGTTFTIILPTNLNKILGVS